MNFGEFHTYFQICFRISRGNYLQIEKSTCVLQNVSLLLFLTVFTFS